MATQGLKTYTSTSAPTRLIGKDDDVTALYNKQYPNASQATPNTYAQSKDQIDQMSLRDRLWDAFNFIYGQQRRASVEQSLNQISQKARNDLSRGMQRSSYGAATEANMRNKMVEAQNDIYSQQLAAYEQALLNVEQQEREQENWQKEFDENVRQFNIIHGIGTGGGGGSGGSGGSSSRSGNGSTQQPKTEADIVKALKDKLGSSDFSNAMNLAGNTSYATYGGNTKVSATTGRAAELNKRTSNINMTR